MYDAAAIWSWETDIRNMPGRTMLNFWMADIAETCAPPVRAWDAPVLEP